MVMQLSMLEEEVWMWIKWVVTYIICISPYINTYICLCVSLCVSIYIYTHTHQLWGYRSLWDHCSFLFSVYHSLHINCGGDTVEANKATYQRDATDTNGATYSNNGDKWALSSTGHYLHYDSGHDRYILSSNISLSMNDPQLYRTARLSPLSLTYYGYCLENGNYTVKLHFAEIVFTDDDTFSSLGRRIFDVYIQV